MNARYETEVEAMRNHIITIILLLIAAIVFTLRYFVAEMWQIYCDIVAFVLPTIAALADIVVSEKISKTTDEEIKKLRMEDCFI